MSRYKPNGQETYLEYLEPGFDFETGRYAVSELIVDGDSRKAVYDEETGDMKVFLDYLDILVHLESYERFEDFLDLLGQPDEDVEGVELFAREGKSGMVIHNPKSGGEIMTGKPVEIDEL